MRIGETARWSIERPGQGQPAKAALCTTQQAEAGSMAGPKKALEIPSPAARILMWFPARKAGSGVGFSHTTHQMCAAGTLVHLPPLCCGSGLGLQLRVPLAGRSVQGTFQRRGPAGLELLLSPHFLL